MERQNLERTVRTQEQTRKQEAAPGPERERLHSAGLTAQLALEGVSLLDMPPQHLEDLAVCLGNSAMQTLLEAQAPQLERCTFRMPSGDPETEPFQVPGGQPLALAQPAGLTETVSPNVAANPSALVI